MQNVTTTVFAKLSQFSSTAFKSAKGDTCLSFLYSRKNLIHCRDLIGGPMPLRGLTAELHFSWRLHVLLHQTNEHKLYLHRKAAQQKAFRPA